MDGRNSISIAVLSNNQDDVELINGTLRDAGLAAHCHWISSPTSLADTLASEQVELLILNCDTYPESIRQVVKQKDRYNPEVPVIAIQESADESAIEAAMRAGAFDLVSMGHKSRLQSVVSRELRALRVERALNSTIQSATEYKRHLKDHMAAVAKSEFGSGEIKLPHTAEALVIDRSDPGAVSGKALSPQAERVSVMEPQDFDVGGP